MSGESVTTEKFYNSKFRKFVQFNPRSLTAFRISIYACPVLILAGLTYIYYLHILDSKSAGFHDSASTSRIFVCDSIFLQKHLQVPPCTNRIKGRRHGDLPEPFPNRTNLFFSFPLCSGTFSQFYALTAGMLWGKAIGATIILPVGLIRHNWSVHAEAFAKVSQFLF